MKGITSEVSVVRDDRARQDCLSGIVANTALILLFLLIGFRCGEQGSIKPLLPRMRARMTAIEKQAAGQTFHVLGNNAAVGSRLALLSAMPLYGPVMASWKLGFPLGVLSRSMIDGINYPSFISLALLLPHGILEYAGFVLMLNSLTMTHFSVAGTLGGRRRRWSSVLRYAVASFVAGLVVICGAAAVECYITPPIVRILVSL